MVDDNATNRRIVQHYLGSWGMASEATDSGASALLQLVQAARAGQPFTVALIDCQMPEMDGFDLARQIKATALIRETGLILLTSLGAHFGPELLAEAGIERCLRKPFRQADLLQVIKTTLQKQRHGETAIPRTPDQPAAPTDAQKSAGFRILLAEDNPVNQKVAQRQLQKLGHTVDSVFNGREALEALERGGYDAVLMDCQMPEMDGYATAREIRRQDRFKDTFIIAMTANAMEGDREKCLAAGMDDYISKPVRIQDLEAALARFREEKTATVEH